MLASSGIYPHLRQVLQLSHSPWSRKEDLIRRWTWMGNWELGSDLHIWGRSHFLQPEGQGCHLGSGPGQLGRFTILASLHP